MRKYRWPTTLPGLNRLAVLLVLACFAVPLFAGEIKLDNSQVPRAPGALKRFKNTRATPPTAFVTKVLENSYPTGKFESLAQSDFAQKFGLKATRDIQAVISGDHVVATIDTATGHADVMPNLSSLLPLAAVTDPKLIPPLPQAVVDAAQKAAADVLRQGAFPAGASSPVLDKMVTLSTSQFKKGLEGAPALMNLAKSGPILATFPVTRMIGNLPVFGVGSTGHIDVGAAGKVFGFGRHWQNLVDNDTVTEERTQAEIGDLIRAQLADLAAKSNIEVQSVHLGYYDADQAFVQPVYQFRAKVTFIPPSGGRGMADEDYIAGYIPIGSPLEAIPAVNDKLTGPGVPQGAPTTLPLSQQLMPTDPPVKMAAMEIPPGDPTIGRYVVRNDYSGWVNSANGFWNGLQASGYGGYFTNSQYYWAYPYEFYGSKNSFINSVHVAEIEVHGDWWLWTTYQDWGEVAYVDNIPSPGLGASAGGVCAYFIVHSCEVVASAADTGSWPDKWWHIFGGLHSVLGYRTIMYIDDGAMWPFGRHMGWGYGLVNSWLSDVASSSMYSGSPGQEMHGSWKPYGRPSTISVCGHENDSVYNTAGVGPAGCLQNYWY